MINIEKPTIKMLHDNEKASEGRFVIEPLERGYGTTLGNSLRRVLLPEPLPPAMPTRSFGATEKDTSFTA